MGREIKRLLFRILPLLIIFIFLNSISFHSSSASIKFTQQLPKVNLFSIAVYFMANYWQLLLLLEIIFALYIFYELYRYNRLSKSGIFDIDKMTGDEFEERLKVLFQNLGYKVTRTGKSGDAGVDLIIEKDNIKTAVQAKCYQGNVGEVAVQQVYTGKKVYNCDRAIIVSNSNFTKMAWEVAKKTEVNLWSRNYLIKVLITEKTLLNQSAPVSK